MTPEQIAAKAPERVALEKHGWYVADVVTSDHIESSEWLPVLRAAILNGDEPLGVDKSVDGGDNSPSVHTKEGAG